MALNIFKELMVKSDNSGEKSTILKPLSWLISILIGGLGLSFYLKAPTWTSILFASIICIIVLLFIFSYVFCLFTDKDALRSEKFSIQKMAIEKGLLGDNISGIQSYNSGSETLGESPNVIDDNSENL